MWLERGDVNCVHCLGLRTASLRFDAKSRPYLVCLSCGSRTFLKGRAALAGLAILDEVVTALAEQAAADPERAAAMQRQLDAFIARLQERRRQPEASSSGVVGVADHGSSASERDRAAG
jgi:hypothetical protein